MFKHTFFMTVSTLVRLLAGVVLFIFLARVLGPEDFGKLMYGFTLASLVVLVVEYGFSQQLLREIGKERTQVSQIMGRVFLAKLLLTILVLLGSYGFFTLFPRSADERHLFYWLLVAGILASFADFFNVAFRGIGRYYEETKVATLSSLFHLGFIGYLAFLNADLTTLAQGFIGSRSMNLALSWVAYQRVIGRFQWEQHCFKTIFTTLKNGFPYAADTGFTSFFGQIDIVIVNYYLGSTAVGIYQAGMRFFQSATQFAPILGNVYLPAIAGCRDNQQLNQLALKFTVQMLVVGTIGASVFIWGGELINRYVLGQKYDELSTLWPYIGILLFLRYLAASQGLLMTASGAQSLRVLSQFISALVLLIAVFYLVPLYALTGMILSLCLMNFILTLIYVAGLKLRSFPVGFTNAVTSTVAIVFFMAVLTTKFTIFG